MGVYVFCTASFSTNNSGTKVNVTAKDKGCLLNGDIAGTIPDTVVLHEVELEDKDGSIYYACESCGSNCTNVVFVSPYGNRYHSTINCDKLKRNVIAVPISEVGERTPCSKCG